MENDTKNQNDIGSQTMSANVSVSEKDNSVVLKIPDFFSENDFARRLFETSKKTEKLISVLFMVSDLLDGHPSIRQKIQDNSIELLDVVYKSALGNGNRSVPFFEQGIVLIGSITSLIELAAFLKLISDMNALILKRELNNISHIFDTFRTEIKTLEWQKLHRGAFSGKLDEDYFRTSNDDTHAPSEQKSNNSSRKTTLMQSDVVLNGQKDRIPQTKNNEVLQIKKDVRNQRLLNLFNLFQKDTEITSKDIMEKIPEYGEKTLQRDLNQLVMAGKLQRQGNKRWSKYRKP